MKGRRIWSSIIAMFAGWLVASVTAVVALLVAWGPRHDTFLVPFWMAYVCLLAWFLIALPAALLVPPRHFLLRRSIAPFFGAAVGFSSMSWLLKEYDALPIVGLAALVGAVAGEVHAWVAPERPPAPATVTTSAEG